MNTTASFQTAAPRKPLRLWPGVIVAVVIVVARFLVPMVVPGTAVYGVIAGAAGAALIALWWVFFSRAAWVERAGALVATVAAYFAMKPLLHESIVGGFMGNMYALFAVPGVLCPAFVAWAVATRRRSDGVRRVTMVVTIVLACAVWVLFRTDGVIGEAGTQLHWRWTPTAEERLLARGEEKPAVVPTDPARPAAPPSTVDAPPAGVPVAAAPETGANVAAKSETSTPVEPSAGDTAAKTSVAAREPEWSGFRGPQRNSVIAGVRIATDWSASPPVQVWRRPIGPGWSSFAVDGGRIFTQEQRGDEEIVSCYRLSTGELIWRHADPVRFYESNGGAGPRGTPTVYDGRVYALGATGILNALDANTGAVLWARNAQADTGAPLPGWGFAGSPLAVGDLVIVATSGRLGGYEIATGKPRWTRMTGGGGYSSPHLVTLDGVQQVLLLHGDGATSVSPRDGSIVWAHEWKYGVAIVQPAVLDERNLLIALGDAMGGSGIRRLGVSRAGNAWKIEERWTTRGLKPYFNDFVVHEGHAYGFDGSILACIELETGERKWKGGRYGQGQMILLPDQDLLLLMSEEGELALVHAKPDAFTEATPRFKAIEGKTWNHPVLLRDLLLVRNGEEMAAFRLTLAGRSGTDDLSPAPAPAR